MNKNADFMWSELVKWLLLVVVLIVVIFIIYLARKDTGNLWDNIILLFRFGG